jgi:hypothetical protein
MKRPKAPAAGVSDQTHADEPIYSADGVDLTLIRWMLSLTPEERLEVLQANVSSILRLRGDGIEA